ncbi:hypothetical protein AC579_6323 [Pseudocercospora musae]|uniref:Translin n=1 Tax=Pseudocercospora musae TaxID=113226 RepID=A0A139I170_9PEZI|nr:hypothetical protein AC579_6323 [Pseudocercospora musae]
MDVYIAETGVLCFAIINVAKPSLMGKRSHADMEGKNGASASSPFMAMFEQFKSELDEHHDRRERIIKASRDITAASKKIIFALQRYGWPEQFERSLDILTIDRVRTLGDPIPPNLVKNNHQYYDTIFTQFSSVSGDLQGLNAHRYARQISGGCQEWMEAVSFEYYLTKASILGFEDAAILLQKNSEARGIELSPEDYVLGIFDMTGELMRFGITSMATRGALPGLSQGPNFGGPKNVLDDMRALRSALEALNAGHGPFAKDVDKKMDVMRSSVEKVEKSLYGLVVRGAERPKGWNPDTETTSRAIEVDS